MLVPFGLARFMSYILNWGGLIMTKSKEHVVDNLDGSTSYWQYRFKSADREKSQPDRTSRQDTGETGIFLLLGILFTIGFLALLLITTLRTIL
jgi:hypothetical protein